MSTNQVTLQDVETAEQAFHLSAKAAGYPDHWAAYRADQRGEQWPLHLIQAHAEYIDRTHRFYAFRDGPSGFLGGRLGRPIKAN